MISVAVHGAEGRMGRLVTALVAADPGVQLAGLVTETGRGRTAGTFHADLPLIGQDEMGRKLPRGCTVIDFSLAAALDGLLAQGQQLAAPLVIGTTGFSPDQMQRLEAYATARPVVLASNFSVGIPAMQMLLQLLGRTLPGGFNAEQVESHHTAKLDKPSGTAKTLAAAYRSVRGGDPVPTHSQRLGGVIGEHTWTFSDQEETLVLTHRAHSRQAFLRGIVPAVHFVAGHEAGLFDLTDVLKDTGSGTAG